MKNFTICQSENAIKISDSYCPGPSSKAYNPIHSIKNAVTCIYKVKLSNENQFRIWITWSNQLTHGFSIRFSDYPFSSSKFSKSTKILRKTQGAESFEYSGSRIEVIWDLNRAQYDSGPEPTKFYYVVVLFNSELGLILGDIEKDLEVKKRILDIKISEFSVISRREYFLGNGKYTTKAKFCDTGTCHDILIERVGDENSILNVYVDKKKVIEVKKLEWNFRGNQIIFLDGLLVDIMWDVYDWLFNPKPKCGYGVFLFRTRSSLDSRLWLEEKNLDQQKEQEKIGFSLMICACKNPG